MKHNWFRSKNIFFKKVRKMNHLAIHLFERSTGSFHCGVFNECITLGSFWNLVYDNFNCQELHLKEKSGMNLLLLWKTKYWWAMKISYLQLAYQSLQMLHARFSQMYKMIALLKRQTIPSIISYMNQKWHSHEISKAPTN